MKKSRSDSRLSALTETQRETLREWLGVEQVGYAEAAARLLAQFGLRTSTTALCNYYQLHVVPWKYARVRGVAADFARLADGEFDDATRKRVQQLAFEIAASPRPDIDALSALSKMLADTAKLKLQQQKLSHDARRIALLERKAAQADEAREVTKSLDLTPEQREQKLKEIFGLK